MAHSLSAKKRIRQNATRRSQNRGRKEQMRTLEKDFETALTAGDQAQAQAKFKELSAYLDKIALTSTLHRNTVARKKSRANKRLAQLKAS